MAGMLLEKRLMFYSDYIAIMITHKTDMKEVKVNGQCK